MTGDPADVGGAEEDIAIVVVEDVLVGLRCVDHVSGGRVEHTLWLAGRSRRVQDKEWVFRLHWLGVRHRVGVCHYVGVPKVTAVFHFVFDSHAAGDAFNDDAGFDGNAHLLFCVGHCFVGNGFHLEGLSSAVGAVAGNEGRAGGVGDTVAEGIGRESTENDRVDRTDTCAGEHGNCEFGDHRHIDGDAVTFFHAT